MNPTYLRYECADAFSLTASSGSSPSAPPSSSVLSFVGTPGPGGGAPLLLSLAGSQVVGYDLRRGEPALKIGHREVLSGGVGTGRALNSGQVVCVDVSEPGPSRSEEDTKVATGWADGSVRVFSVGAAEIREFASSSAGDGAESGLVHSLLDGGINFLGNTDDCREPLVLNGHSSPVQMVKFDKGTGTGAACGRLASGSADGVVILWDVVAETGLFRLLGHRGPVTGISFFQPGENAGGIDGLVTSGADSLVKVWDLGGQCCVQTLTGHRGPVGCLDCSVVKRPGGAGPGGEGENQWRLVTGCADGQVRVWTADPAARPKDEAAQVAESDGGQDKGQETPAASDDDVFRYVGSLAPPATLNMTPSNSEGIASVHFHPDGGRVAVCRSNDRVIEVYAARSEVEVQKKRRRRLRRRREKRNAASIAAPKTARKRGLLDDSESEDDGQGEGGGADENAADAEAIKAMDEFEFAGLVRAGHKVRGFAFVPGSERGGGVRIATALATNALEVHSLPRPSKKGGPVATADKVATMDMHGHPTGIRSTCLSSDDRLACTVSKSVVKVWNVRGRSCLRSTAASPSGSKSASYCLCSSFLPGDGHVVLGTREGHILILDVASGDVVFSEEGAHDGAIWSLDVYEERGKAIVATGSADKLVKMWEVETDDETGLPVAEHVRSLQMSDDVMCVRFSKTKESTKRLIFVASLDSTIKVFFNDSLKFFLSLYGHKLPVLALDCSADDAILASGAADKSIKIWGLDFGDTHRTLYGHGDSVTDLRFAGRTRHFFTSSKDGTVRYWDGDKFEQILLLRGHASEVCSLAVSRGGSFVLSAGMDRQVRVWERTKDMVFLDEERERELEGMFDKVDGRDESTADALRRAGQDGGDGNGDDGEDNDNDAQPQSEAAVRRSILSVSSGDRIMDGIETADKESKEIASFRRLAEEKGGQQLEARAPNPLLFGMDPPSYVLWILRSVKSADLEQSLLVLPLGHVGRLMHYLIALLRRGNGVEVCARVAVFLVRAHQAQIVSNRTMTAPLRELRGLVRDRTTDVRDTVGFNMAALRMIARIADEKRNERIGTREKSMKEIWGNLAK